jgi:hypothetical protein
MDVRWGWNLMPGRGLAAVVAIASGCGPSLPSATGCQAALVPGDLVITEVFADYRASSDGDGTDTGKEWFEIYNATGAAIELAGLTLVHSRPDGSKRTTHVVSGARIASGQFFTLGDASPGQLPDYVDYGYGDDLGDLYNSDGGKLALACGDREIDSAVYGDVEPGHARELGSATPPDYTSNDDPAAWCEATDTEFEAGNFGTPGAASDCQPIASGQCSERGALRSAVPPGPGDLVITEVMPSPAHTSDATGEWFEALAMADVDLNGVALDRAGDAARPDVITASDCVHVAAGSYAVFARATDPAANGGLPAAAIAGTFRFSLVAGSAAAPGDVAILAGTTVVDAVRWTRSTAGAALQLAPDRLDAASNDSESNFCDATVHYASGDLGTPGAANSRCPALPASGLCDEDGARRAIISPRVGELVISELLINPANVAGSSDAQREWFEVANAGAAAFDLNGLGVGRIGATGAAVQSAACLALRPGGYAVFARSPDPAHNAMLPRVDATFGFGLVDTRGDVQVTAGASVLDAVRWSSVVPGVTRQRDPAQLTATGAPSDASGAGFCAGTAAYGDGTNLGTPGAANPPCR